MRRPVDGHAGIQQSLTHGINVVDAVSQVPEVTALAVILGIPVVRQFNLRFFVSRRRQEHQRKPALLAVEAPEFIEPELVAIKVQ